MSQSPPSQPQAESAPQPPATLTPIVTTQQSVLPPPTPPQTATGSQLLPSASHSEATAQQTATHTQTSPCNLGSPKSNAPWKYCELGFPKCFLLTLILH